MKPGRLYHMAKLTIARIRSLCRLCRTKRMRIMSRPSFGPNPGTGQPRTHVRATGPVGRVAGLVSVSTCGAMTSVAGELRVSCASRAESRRLGDRRDPTRKWMFRPAPTAGWPGVPESASVKASSSSGSIPTRWAAAATARLRRPVGHLPGCARFGAGCWTTECSPVDRNSAIRTDAPA